MPSPPAAVPPPSGPWYLPWRPAEPPGGGPPLSDLHRAAHVVGGERAPDDVASVCTAGGVPLRNVNPAPGVFRIIEAPPA